MNITWAMTTIEILFNYLPGTLYLANRVSDLLIRLQKTCSDTHTHTPALSHLKQKAKRYTKPLS